MAQDPGLPVTPVTKDGREGVQIVGSNLSDLIPITPAAEPTFSPGVLLYVSAVGVIHVLTSSGQDRSYASGAIPAGTLLPLVVTKVYSDTTATVFAAVPGA